MTLTQQQKLWLGTSLVLGWLVATVYAFWWFQYRHLQLFSGDPQTTTVMFDSSSLRDQLARVVGITMANKGQATVVHYWDSNCPCNKFNEAHVKQLMQHYGKQGVRFVVVASGDMNKARQIFSDSAVAAYVDVLPPQSQPPSSPAVAVMDAQGELAYFGPYSVGAVCSVQSGAFVEKALDKVLVGTNPKQVNTLAVGCYCPWPKVS